MISKTIAMATTLSYQHDFAQSHLSDTEKIQLALYVLLSPEYDDVWNQLKSMV